MRPAACTPTTGQRVRIARVIARLNVGGPAMHVCQLTSRLPADRFDTRLFVGELSDGEIEMRDAIERFRVDPVRVRGLGRAVRARDDVRALAQLVREFRAFRPHIVHTHTAKAGALGRLAAVICNVPKVVHTFHGHVFDGYFSSLATKGFLGIERALARVTDRVVAISPRQAADLTQRYRIASSDRFSVIPLGFDFSNFESIDAERGTLRRELGIGTSPIVSVVGRLTAIKDHALLFRAVALSKTDNVHLLVVGGGELELELRQLAAQLGIAPRVHFLGFRRDIIRVLADTDVLALTSKNEGTPVAVIEALAAGCMPVSVDVGGVADVLMEGEFGRLVATRSPEAFAHALDEALAATPSAQWRSAAQRYARNKYSLDRLVEDHIRLYSALLKS